jgi:hypothetical protein
MTLNPNPIWISLYIRKIWLSFLSVWHRCDIVRIVHFLPFFHIQRRNCLSSIIYLTFVIIKMHYTALPHTHFPTTKKGFFDLRGMLSFLIFILWGVGGGGMEGGWGWNGRGGGGENISPFFHGTARGAAAAGVPTTWPAAARATSRNTIFGVFWTHGLQYGGLWHETHARIGSYVQGSPCLHVNPIVPQRFWSLVKPFKGS